MARAQVGAGIEFHPRTLLQIPERELRPQKEHLKPLQSIELNLPP